MSTLIAEGSEWTYERLEQFDAAIAQVAAEYKLDTYPNQIEIIASEQMMDAYSATGMPVSYPHWSFGKQFMNVEKHYKRGHMGLAYELVINSNPCISYLMEENTLTMQALVIAHACYGHNSFFKGNYLFKTWTSADSIVDYLLFAKKYVMECEERYGIDKVERLLDACHALMNYGVDKYRRPQQLSLREEQVRQANREAYLQSQVNELWRTLPQRPSEREQDATRPQFPREPEENILYFLEKNAPLLEPWEREIIRIVRKMAQYFYPQRQTKLMNEGWATFWHYTILNTLYERGQVNDQFMVEFLHNHTNVIYQPNFDDPHFAGLNPYTLGFAMFQDLRRICEHPTAEDKLWFKDIAGTPWLETLDFAMRNFKDDSFIAQFLSPKVIRDLKLFVVQDDDQVQDLTVTHIHNENSYQAIRETLSQSYNLSEQDPNIQIYRVDKDGDRSISLRHLPHCRRPLVQSEMKEVMRHLYHIWGFSARLDVQNAEGTLELLYQCPEPEPEPATAQAATP